MDRIEQLMHSMPLLYRMAFSHHEQIALFEADAQRYFADLYNVPKENVNARYDEDAKEMDVEVILEGSRVHHLCTFWR